MSSEVARLLEDRLDQLLLKGNRDTLCSPVIEASPPGLDGQTYPILTALHRRGPQTAARLAQAIGIDRSGISRYADRLQAMGLLRRVVDPDDRRGTLLELTDQGQHEADRLHRVLADVLATKIAEWPAGQAEALIRGIELLIDLDPQLATAPGSRRSAPV